MLFSVKGISMCSMVGLILLNPSNALKISFCHFLFNMSMAAVVLLFPKSAAPVVSTI